MGPDAVNRTGNSVRKQDSSDHEIGEDRKAEPDQVKDDSVVEVRNPEFKKAPGGIVHDSDILAKVAEDYEVGDTENADRDHSE